VENVVYPPISPTARNGRRNRRGGQTSSRYTMSAPRTKLPETLTTKIAHGNPCPAGNAADSTYRARLPIPPPTAIDARSAAPGPELLCGRRTGALVAVLPPVLDTRLG